MRMERGCDSRSESERRNARRPRRRSRGRRIQAGRRMPCRRLRTAALQTPVAYERGQRIHVRVVVAARRSSAKRSFQIARANARAIIRSRRKRCFTWNIRVSMVRQAHHGRAMSRAADNYPNLSRTCCSSPSLAASTKSNTYSKSPRSP
jgi:hypothetical protein